MSDANEALTLSVCEIVVVRAMLKMGEWDWNKGFREFSSEALERCFY